MPLLLAGQTDVGRHRRDNQDTFVHKPLWSAQDALLLVIDGVGGYAGGAEAATIAREAIVQYMTTPTGDTLTMLREAVVHANNQIVKQRQQDPALARMCCVLTVAVADVESGRLLFVHVGDTRLYLFRQQELKKLTHDHSLVGVREDADQLTEREAMNHPRRNEILREVGSMPHRIDDPDFLEWGETDFLPGDVLLLCSDGLTDSLTRAQLTATLTLPNTPGHHVANLIELANEHGGRDNITVVLAQYPLPADRPGKQRHIPPVRTADPPLAALIAETGSVPEAGPTRTWWRPLAVLGVLAVLPGLLWWLLTPADVPRPAPIDRTDSVTVNSVQRDSISSKQGVTKSDTSHTTP